MTIELNTSSIKEAVSIYLSVLYRFHKMTDKEQEIAVALIVVYLRYLDKYKAPEIADRLYLDKESRKLIKDELGIKPAVFNNYLAMLKKKQVISAENVIARSLVPVVRKESTEIAFRINIVEEINEKRQ